MHHLPSSFVRLKQFELNDLSTPIHPERYNLKDGQGHSNVIVPPLMLSLLSLDTVRRLFERCRQRSDQAQTLATLRDTLLPRLISGQLRLPEAEVSVEEIK